MRNGKINDIKLSNDRAAVVAEALIKSGIPRERITVKGYGTQKPERMVEIVIK